MEPVSLMEYFSMTKYKNFLKEKYIKIGPHMKVNLDQLNTRIYLRLLILSVLMMLTVYAFPQVFDFTIAEDDVEILNGMHDGRHVSWDPSFIV